LANAADLPGMPRLRDPRPWQIGVLASLLVVGIFRLEFAVSVLQVAAGLAGCLAAQLACTRLWRLPRFEPQSALISGLSLALLLRTEAPAWAAAAGVLAVASKFLLRWNGKHVFNPTCFAIAAALCASDRVWVSAGQWGSGALVAVGVAGLGLLVLSRGAHADVTFAFLGAWSALVLGRALWLGDPLAIPLHGLQSGALLLFAFFMISDPRTIPDTRAGRIVFAALVALGAGVVQFVLFQPNALIWSLAGLAPAAPLLDRLLPGERYAWGRGAPAGLRRTLPMRRIGRFACAALSAAGFAAAAPEAAAFCGFYVARADAKLFNQASQVVLARDGERTVMTLSNDYRGDPTEFALVVPVPTFLERGQIHVGDRAAIEHLDAYTAPRLVEYFDPDPCALALMEERLRAASPEAGSANRDASARAKGVTIEARYSVGEYEILILSAEESRGLAGWLRENGWKLPDGAEPVLESYLKQGMRFFVAKVDLAEHARLGYAFLRPLQVAYESPKFMLPIRLGTLNADGPQELFLWTLTRRGRVETTNYRSVKLPSDAEIPAFVKEDFADFYRALFAEQTRREDMRVVFTEYAWDMAWCDPCAADPLSREELRGLGVFWLDGGVPAPEARRGAPSIAPLLPAAQDVFVTRLHVRYDGAHFPADLVLQETGDRSNFQGRYVLRHPFTGEARCPAAEAYRRGLRERREREARTLASLTGWSLDDVRRRLRLDAPLDPDPGPRPWWRDLWPQ
jgi:Na+-translocating ferredoxin:NAD+ oxidoreductase RnfD subunit